MNRNDYTALLYRLFPKGKTWPVDAVTTPVWHSLLYAMAAEPARLDAAAHGFLQDLIPAPDMTEGLLAQWEGLLGLTPQAADSTAARRTAIRARLGSHLSPSVTELTARAVALKASATLTQHMYSIFLAGVGVCGDAVRSPQFLSVWKITYTGPTDASFEAAMLAVSPVNTTLLFEVV